jgi:acetolactate synthase-1/2/3 large subunit
VLVDTLVALGVRSFYTVPGESFLEVIDAASEHPDARVVSTRHESGASFMAEAEAKLTGVPAVAMGTRAVGAANLSIGVHTALHDSTPMVVLLGQVATGNSGREAFQEIDLEAFYRPITKWATTLRDPSHAAEVAYRAVVAATSGRPGPVVVVLPADVLAGAAATATGLPGARRLPVGRAEPAPAEVAEIRSRLLQAARPVVVAGGGCSGARGELIEVAERYGTGVYSAFRRQDVFPNDHPCYLGHLSLGSSPAVLRAVREADLVLAVGCRLSEVTTQAFTVPSPASLFVHVDVEPLSMGRGRMPDLAVVADARLALAALLAGTARRAEPPDWSEAHRAYEQDSTPPAPTLSARLQPGDVVRAMTEVLPEDALIANDAGNFSIFVHRYWRYRHPRSQLAPTSGAMGYGVPAAVAAALSEPDRTVVATCGDGGFLMTGQEIETAVRYGCDLTVIVFRNGLYATIAMHQARVFGRTAAVDIGPVDLAGCARSLGAAGFAATDRESLTAALREALALPGPAVVDVATDPDAMTPDVGLSELLSRHSHTEG